MYTYNEYIHAYIHTHTNIAKIKKKINSTYFGAEGSLIPLLIFVIVKATMIRKIEIKSHPEKTGIFMCLPGQTVYPNQGVLVRL